MVFTPVGKRKGLPLLVCPGARILFLFLFCGLVGGTAAVHLVLVSFHENGEEGGDPSSWSAFDIVSCEVELSGRELPIPPLPPGFQPARTSRPSFYRLKIVC